MAAESWLLLMQGKVVEASIAVYTDPMGYWFFIIMLAMLTLMIYIKTESVMPPLLINIIASGIIISMAPAGARGISELLTIMYVLFGLSTTAIIYKLYKGSK